MLSRFFAYVKGNGDRESNGAGSNSRMAATGFRSG